MPGRRRRSRQQRPRRAQCRGGITKKREAGLRIKPVIRARPTAAKTSNAVPNTGSPPPLHPSVCALTRTPRSPPRHRLCRRQRRRAPIGRGDAGCGLSNAPKSPSRQVTQCPSRNALTWRTAPSTTCERRPRQRCNGHSSCNLPLRGPVGPPEPGAPPCMRQRLLPVTAGDWHGLPERVLAPQRGARCSCMHRGRMHGVVRHFSRSPPPPPSFPEFTIPTTPGLRDGCGCVGPQQSGCGHAGACPVLGSGRAGAGAVEWRTPRRRR